MRTLPDGPWRMILHGHYRIVYLRRSDGETLDAIGVFHGALDIDRYLP